ncbi:MAG: HipA domain-containing protein [Polaromonas sp.]|nr:HipA domain-containing protein [Polaromonas sp.]
MKFPVYVLGRDVAALEQAADLKSVLTYHADTAPGDFVSLTLPVRTEPYVLDDAVHWPFAVGGTPGRVQVAARPRGCEPEPAPQPPFAALNAHLCAQVASRVMLTAHTDISDDGQTLMVHRFDLDAQGQPHWGVEDFGVLLGLHPATKHDTSWEQIAQAVRDHVPGSRRGEAFRHLATSLLLSYALRNASCHARTLALRYTSPVDVQAAPACGMLTTRVYAGMEDDLPALAFMGKKTWTPGRNMQKFIATAFGIAPKEQSLMAEAVCDAVADVAPQVLEAMKKHPAFTDMGRGMLAAWTEGVQGLRDKHVYALGAWEAVAALEGSV